ncbi:hypothetical protein MTR67_017714 [Solanum verrucosum]|uniref:Uncharacterized protein n=1 Tax=Solanum verrucosum TaxID=315347 RepID=A0AAF0QIG9_SOLVR|nr:hypothetical protein MTR67_017714 [Solanum verrucosum]
MINMDFIIGLPRSRRQHYSIWVIVNRMTKLAHFLPTAEDYAMLYLQEVVRLHGVPVSINSDRDRWASRAHYSDLRGYVEGCMIDFKCNWDDHLPLIEFAYNNSCHSSIQMDLYEALYGRSYRSPIGWFDVGEAGLKVIPEKLKTAQSRQKSYIDIRRRELEFKVDD